jgi:hypothetical protein
MKLPTSEELSRLGPLELLSLWKLVQNYKAKLAFGGCGVMPASAVEDLVKAVPDEMVHAIVHDNRRGIPEPGSLAGSSGGPVVRGTGWQKPLPLEGSVPGIRYVDQLCDVQDAVDKAENMKRVAAAIIGNRVKP